MNAFTFRRKKGLFLMALSSIAFLQLYGGEVAIINENIQTWKAVTAYKDGTQEIPVKDGVGIVELTQVGVTKSGYPDGITDAGPCSEGYIRMSNSQGSMVKLPVISAGVTKIELNIITAATAARTVDVKVIETSAVKTLTGLGKTGGTYTMTVGTSGSTTLVLENVTGGVIYITDIKVYQNGDTPVPSEVSLATLAYRTGSQDISIPGFNPSKTDYSVELPAGTTAIPTVSATPNPANAILVITQATQLPGNAVITVTSADGTAAKEYTVRFTVASSGTNPQPETHAALPLNVSGSADKPLEENDGFLAQNLGTPMTDGGAKFEGSKALTENKPTLILAFNESAGQLSFEAKGNRAGSPTGFEGIDFVVEESPNGDAYSQLADLSASLTTNAQTFGEYSIKTTSRFIRWTYRSSIKGNIALNNIVLTKQTTAIIPIEEQSVAVYAKDGIVYVTGAVGETAEIVDFTGRLLIRIPVIEPKQAILVGTSQLIIVKIGKSSVKLAL
ncbi:MAG: hypothetical protein LBD45_04415 [Bacteroidales bacterium]|jgi:hypothetical protein|nr:hypothetical protein [Bacteroidales bacterium]